MFKNIFSSSLQELIKLFWHLIHLVHPELQLLQLLPHLVLLNLCLLLPFPETKCCCYFVAVIFLSIFCRYFLLLLWYFCYFVVVICQLISPCHNIFGCLYDLSAHLVWPDMSIIEGVGKWHWYIISCLVSPDLAAVLHRVGWDCNLNKDKFILT